MTKARILAQTVSAGNVLADGQIGLAELGLENVSNTADGDKQVLSATTWTTARTLNYSGDAVGSSSVDGSQDVTTTLTLSTSGVTAGTYGSATNIPQVTVDAKGRVTTVSNVAVSIPSGSLTFTGDVSGSGSTGSSTTLTLANIGTSGTYTKITTDAKGRVTSGTVLAASDIPNLDAAKITSGVLDAARLPSYVDDILEYSTLASFPVTGETGKIYVDLSTNKTYRWSGSVYVYITSGAVDSVAGKTGVVTLVKGDVGLGNVENTALSTWAGSANITTLGTITTGTWSGTAIALNKLAASTISGVSLGNNLNTLTLNVSGTGLSGSTTYNGSAAATFTVTSNATNANTASTVVARDASGNFSAGTITATLSGNATNVTGTVAIANGGTGATTAAAARTNLGATTLGSNLFTITNPSAVTFPRFNADNTVSALDAATFRTAIGAGTSSTTGTVTSVAAGSYLTGGTITTTGTLAVDATSANTASKVVARDASGNFSAGTITATLSGTATQVSNTLTRGSYLTGNNFNGSAATTWAVDADSANTASKVVARDASGNFSAGTITATLSGNASTATTLQTARTLTIGSTGKTFNGSADVAWSLAEIGAATTSHTHTTLTSSGAITAETLTTDAPAGLTMRLAYTNGYPTSYGNVISLGGQGHGQIFIGWSGTSGAHADNYIRSQRDTADANWSEWAKIWTDANDGSGSGLDADLLDGLHIHTGTNNEANKVVRTDASGYIQAGWINTISGDNGTTAITRIYASHDGYIRYYTLANFGAQLTNLNASNLASGTVSTARLGSGTANSSTYLRGDGTWATAGGNSVSVISTNTTAVSGSTYALTASLQLTLPASPSAGNSITIINASSTTTCTVNRNGQNIMGMAEDLVINAVGASFDLIYIDATRGWWIK